MEKKPRVGAGIPNTASCSPLSAPLSWHLETQPEQHQQVPFPLSCAGAALPGHSSVGRRVWAAAHVLAPAEPPWLAQQQVAVAVSPVMRMDVAHQAPLRELTQTLLSFCEVQRGEFLNCLMPQGHQSSLKGQEHRKATRSWCNQLEKDAEGIKPQCLALTGRGGAGLGECLLRCGKCKIDFLLHLARFSLSSPLLHPFMIKFKNNSDFKLQTHLKV